MFLTRRRKWLMRHHTRMSMVTAASVAHNWQAKNKIKCHTMRRRRQRYNGISTCSRIFQSLVGYACCQFTVSFSSQFSCVVRRWHHARAHTINVHTLPSECILPMARTVTIAELIENFALHCRGTVCSVQLISFIVYFSISPTGHVAAEHIRLLYIVRITQRQAQWTGLGLGSAILWK